MQQDDHLTWSLQKRLTRRELLKGAALASVGVAGTALVGCAGAAATPTPVPTPAKVGKGRRVGPRAAIATKEADAYAWWLDQVKTSTARMEDLALTPDEETKVKAMGLTIGATWPDLSQLNVYTANIVESRCQELGIDLINVGNGGSLKRHLATAKMFINEGVDAVVGWPLRYESDEANEAVKLLQEAGIPAFSCKKPLAAYYPPVCVVGPNRYQDGADQARIMAKKLAVEGYAEANVGHISPLHPTF